MFLGVLVYSCNPRFQTCTSASNLKVRTCTPFSVDLRFLHQEKAKPAIGAPIFCRIFKLPMFPKKLSGGLSTYFCGPISSADPSHDQAQK